MFRTICLGVMAFGLCSTFAVAGVGTGTFVRGDSNGDGGLDIGDAIYTLTGLFSGGPPPVCDDAADTNDDGSLNIADAIYTLTFLFTPGSPPPPAPHPVAGLDSTPDGLICNAPCTDPTLLAAGVVLLFPLEACIPSLPFSATGVTGTACTSTTGPICSPLAIAGCDTVTTLNTFVYDAPSQTFTMNTTTEIDPLGLQATVLFSTISCETSGTVVITNTLTLVTTPLGPGVAQIDDAIVNSTVDTLSIDFSPCGLLGTVAGLLLPFFETTIEATIEDTVATQLTPLLVGQIICVN
ncbi:MAG: hypothetical protein ACKVX7_11325 [Planctomycetota bacterium]